MGILNELFLAFAESELKYDLCDNLCLFSTNSVGDVRNICHMFLHISE